MVVIRDLPDLEGFPKKASVSSHVFDAGFDSIPNLVVLS